MRLMNIRDRIFSRLRKSILCGWNITGSFLDRREPLPTGAELDIKIALVKNSYFFDLYQEVNTGTYLELIGSSHKRSGPVGLFTELDADFIIVDVYPEADGQVYRERLHQIRDAEFDEYMQHAQQLKKVSVNAANVDWSVYDLVIALDNAVPASVTEKYPRVVWATMLENHKMPSYQGYLRKPPVGYDVFLTQHFGPNLRQLKYGKHVVDWPYGFSKSGSVARLFNEIYTREGVTIESHGNHLWDGFSEESGIRVRFQGGHRSFFTITEILEMLLRSRYFCSVSPKRPLWGNALVEAASAGCLLIADPNWQWNPYIILPELRVANVTQAKRKILELEANSELRAELLGKQNERLDWYAFNRPLLQLKCSVLSMPRKTSLLEKMQACS